MNTLYKILLVVVGYLITIVLNSFAQLWLGAYYDWNKVLPIYVILFITSLLIMFFRKKLRRLPWISLGMMIGTLSYFSMYLSLTFMKF